MLKTMVILGALTGMMIGLTPGTLGREEPGWYLVILEGDESLTARLVEVEADFYVVSFQGSVLRVAKSKVREFKRLSRPETAPALVSPARKTPENEAGGEAPAPEEISKKEEELRDAVESLASPDNAVVARAYRFLANDIDGARPILHGSLRHPNARVRKVSVKLLGARGTLKEDLSAVTARLADEKSSVRLAAAMAVRALGPEGLPALVRYLDTESIANNRKLAVKTLQHWRDQRAVAPLVERLVHETDEGVRGFIEVALQELTGKEFGRDPEAWTDYLAEIRNQKELEQISGAALPAGEAGSDESAPSAQE